jgi:hypothetical protein
MFELNQECVVIKKKKKKKKTVPREFNWLSSHRAPRAQTQTRLTWLTWHACMQRGLGICEAFFCFSFSTVPEFSGVASVSLFQSGFFNFWPESTGRSCTQGVRQGCQQAQRRSPTLLAPTQGATQTTTRNKWVRCFRLPVCATFDRFAVRGLSSPWHLPAARVCST